MIDAIFPALFEAFCMAIMVGGLVSWLFTGSPASLVYFVGFAIVSSTVECDRLRWAKKSYGMVTA